MAIKDQSALHWRIVLVIPQHYNYLVSVGIHIFVNSIFASTLITYRPYYQ